MKMIKKCVAALVAAAAIGATVALAPVASANTDPVTPYGTDPTSPAIFGYHQWYGDDTDVPF
jgi:hypothetical protein